MGVMDDSRMIEGAEDRKAADQAAEYWEVQKNLIVEDRGAEE